jgi:hypothetical protein
MSPAAITQDYGPYVFSTTFLLVVWCSDSMHLRVRIAVASHVVPPGNATECCVIRSQDLLHRRLQRCRQRNAAGSGVGAGLIWTVSVAVARGGNASTTAAAKHGRCQ